MQNEKNTKTIKQLQWQCRRGMLELDVILISFLEEHFELLDAKQKIAFSELLSQADPDLYTWIMGFGKCQLDELIEIISIIRKKMSIA